jgi:hypothetical protein
MLLKNKLQQHIKHIRILNVPTLLCCFLSPVGIAVEIDMINYYNHCIFITFYYALTFKCWNRQFCPSFCIGTEAKMDIFVQKHICRFFTLNMILAGHCVNVYVVLTYCKLKTDLSVVPYAKGVYRCMEVVYHTAVYWTLLRDMYSASCSSTSTFRYLRCPLNTILVGW